MLALALVAASCSSGDAGASATTEAPGSDAATATTAAPGGATTTTEANADDGRPTIILGGDSVMGNLAPGIIAALGDQADASYLAQARISGDAAATQAWTQAIEEQDPDLVVVHVGSWEVLSPEFHPGVPGGVDPYADEVLDPFVDLLTSGGAQVLFIGPAAARSEQRTVNLITFNRELIELAERNDAVDFLNAGTYVNDATGGFTETLPGPDGVPVRIRRTDELGLHLCPAGVVRLAAPVVQWISDHLAAPVTPVDGWDHGDWSRSPLLEKPEQCPAVA